MVDRSIRGGIGVTSGAVIVVVGTFLPWLRSGARGRSSYAIFDLVDRLGFAPDGVVAWSLRLWPLVPLLLVAMSVTGWAVVSGHLRWRWSAGVSAVGVVWIGGTASVIALAPDTGLFRIGVGPVVAVCGLIVAAIGVVWLRPRRSAASEAA